MKKLGLIFLLTLLPALSAAAQSLNGTWKGTLEVGPQKLTLVLHVDTAGKKAKLDVVEQGATGIDMTVNHLSADSIDVAIPQLALTYAGRLNGGKIVGTFRQQTFSTRLTFEAGTVTSDRPQTPRPPYPYKTEEVSFDNAKAHVTLAGTLTYPTDYTPGKPVPAVPMVTGSGPQDRDEKLMGHSPFLVIADYLARHGIASLRYDDRGCARSTGNYATATIKDFTEDAGYGIDYLRRLKTFSQIGVLGHSEGGSIAYILAAEGKTDFVVSLSGPACKIDTMMMMQLNKIGRAQGATGDVAANVGQARQILLSVAGSAEIKSFLDMDMTGYVRQTHCPVLALGGASDLNVPVEINVPALKKNLPDNPKNLIKVYPGLNHLLQPEVTGNPLRIASVEETISPEALHDMAAWINGL